MSEEPEVFKLKPREDRPATIEEHRALRESVAKLKAWIADLQSGMYVNCVYCGHRYGPGETTPVSMADALKAHVEQCPDHPMSRLRARVAELELQLAAERERTKTKAAEVMQDAWPEFGGNHMVADWWSGFAAAIDFLLKWSKDDGR